MDRQTDRLGQILMPPDYRHGGVKKGGLWFLFQKDPLKTVGGVDYTNSIP